MRANELVETSSGLYAIVIDGGMLIIDGWIVSDVGPMDTLKVSGAGRALTGFQLSKDLPSPDIKALFPGWSNADNCRFQVTLPLSQAEQEQLRSAVIVLTPILRGGEGCVLAGIPYPVLPLPSQAEIDSIGCSDCWPDSFQNLGFFIGLAGLQPTEDVLDVGCGMGRMAYSLVHYLAPTARYEGFDIMGNLIQWCQQTITPRFPNFTFRQADIFNKNYNPTGTTAAAEFIYPYEDERFDFVFLTSVFTHMLAPDVRHYLDEIYRVLKPGGRCLATVFLLNPESERLIEAGKSTQGLVHSVEESLTADPAIPEASVGFKEVSLLKWIAERHFTVAGKYYGFWCGRPRPFSAYQDMLLFYK
jgi:SAM-dependent methyltransferase